MVPSEPDAREAKESIVVEYAVKDGDTGYAMASGMDYDVLIVDRMLPRRDGLSIVEALRANSRVLDDPAPVVAVRRLSDAGIVFAVAPWVEVTDYVPAAGEINQAILEAFRARNIALAVPQREIRSAASTAYLRRPDERLAGRDAA